jgi:hypothetical protein
MKAILIGVNQECCKEPTNCGESYANCSVNSLSNINLINGYSDNLICTDTDKILCSLGGENVINGYQNQIYESNCKILNLSGNTLLYGYGM